MNLKVPTNSCDPDRLESFLNGGLSKAEECEVTSHLNTCENCRHSLERLAAEPEIWREAEQLLQPSTFQAPGYEDSDLEPGPGAQPPQIKNVLEALRPTDDPQMLGRIGGYEVSGVVGSGGMGVVLKAVDTSLDRTVAIKVLAPHLACSGAARKRFSREAKAAAAVLHPNVIAIHSVSNDDSLPYLVMPYVRGTSLQKRLDAEGPLPLNEILRIGSQIAAGLAAAHAQGLVHRDIKPANILLEQGVERVTITDFGLARAVDDATITQSGMIAGTPQYMSPEQARGESVEQRSDLFSLGSVLYAICTGRPPFRAESTYGVIRRIIDDEPTSIREINPEVPEWLCSIISRLMAKRVGDRFASAAEVTELLEKCLAHVQQPAMVPLPASLAPQFGRRSVFNSRRKGVIAMFAALGMTLLGMALWQASGAPDIAGEWTSEEWGKVVLVAKQAGQYEGTLTRPDKGSVQLKWSRTERRFNGTWTSGDEPGGKISLRLVDQEIRGARMAKSKGDADSPKLAEFSWTRFKPTEIKPAAPTFGEVFERVVKNREAIDFDTGKVVAMPDAELNLDKGLLWLLEHRLASITEWMKDQHLDALSEGSSLTAFDLKVNELSDEDWDSITPSKLVEATQMDFQKVNPRQFAIAIRAVDPNSRPHVILAIRSQPRTIGFRTREGAIGLLKIVEATKNEGLKVRFKLIKADFIDEPAPSSSEGNAKLVAQNAEPSSNEDAMPRREHVFPTKDIVTAIAYTADTNLIAAGWNRSVEILDASPGPGAGKTVASIRLTTKSEEAILDAAEGIPHFEVRSMAFSPDGEMVAVGTSLGQVKLFNARTGELILSLDDEPARLAQKRTPEKLKSLKRAMGQVGSLAFSPGGTLLATCGSSFDDFPLDLIERGGLPSTGPGRLKVWDVKTGKLIHDLPGHSHAEAVSFSPDGNLLASAGRWSGHEHGTGVIIWNVQTGKKLNTLLQQANAGTHAVTFSPTNKLVAVASRRYDKENDTYTTSLSLVYAMSGITEWTQTIPGFANPKFAPDGKTVVVLCGGHSIKFIETATGRTKHEIKSADFLPANPRQGSQWFDFAITQIGRTRLVIGGADKDRKGVIELWDLEGSNPSR